MFIFAFGQDLYADIVGRETAAQYKTALYLVASASAEVIADVALCPMESVKVRMQTSLPGTNFPSELGAAVRAIHAEQGIGGFYKSVVPLWMRQVPYTMVKFACFERTVEAFYNHVFTAGRDNYSKGTQLSITFASGYIAGVFCAIVSHPADSVVSKLNQSPGKGIGGILAELGPMGIWRGLVARIIMIGTLTGLQWWIYDSFKVAMGLSASGGGVKKVGVETPALEHGKATAEHAAERLEETTDKVEDAAFEFAHNAREAAVEVADEVKEDLSAAAETVHEELSELADEAREGMDEVSSELERDSQQVRESAEQLAEDVRADVAEAKRGARETAEQLDHEARDAIADGAQAVAGAADRAADWVTESVKENEEK